MERSCEGPKLREFSFDVRIVIKSDVIDLK